MVLVKRALGCHRADQPQTWNLLALRPGRSQEHLIEEIVHRKTPSQEGPFDPKSVLVKVRCGMAPDAIGTLVSRTGLHHVVDTDRNRHSPPKGSGLPQSAEQMARHLTSYSEASDIVKSRDRASSSDTGLRFAPSAALLADTDTIIIQKQSIS